MRVRARFDKVGVRIKFLEAGSRFGYFRGLVQAFKPPCIQVATVWPSGEMAICLMAISTLAMGLWFGSTLVMMMMPCTMGWRGLILSPALKRIGRQGLLLSVNHPWLEPMALTGVMMTMYHTHIWSCDHILYPYMLI